MPACIAFCGASYFERFNCNFLTVEEINVAPNINKKVNRNPECYGIEIISIELNDYLSKSYYPG
jgi:N-dimethylarginine dimethylaminohydrolase